MDPNLPDAMEIDCSPDRIRRDLLDRLHWNTFGPLDEISVRDGTTLTPLSNHDIRFESVADPPISRLAILIMACEEKHSFDEHDEEYRYQPPKPLMIEKLNGTPITIEDFIAQVHSFLNANKDEIYKCVDESYVQPTNLANAQMYVGIDVDACTSVEEEESHEPKYFWRGGNIPEGSRFFFDEARFNEPGTDEFEAYIEIFVEGNMGVSFEQFWECRARV